MIKSLYIKNFILIDELFLDFEKGVNVFTGETGAGKTIILRAIDIVFGAKVNRDVLKDENKNALIELSFDNCGEEVIISREITKTGTKPRINGAFVNLEAVKEIREGLVDIHSQNQTYTYIAPKYHIELLDSFIEKENFEYGKKLEEYKEKYVEYRELAKKCEALKENYENTLRTIDFLKFEIKEIEDAEIYEGEEKELNSELEILANAEELKEASYGAYWGLAGDEKSILEGLSNVQAHLSRAIGKDENLKDIYSRFVDYTEEIRSIASEFRDYGENLKNDPERLDEINERLALIEKLKRKYGNDLNEALINFQKELDLLSGEDCNLELLEKRKEELFCYLKDLAFSMSHLRKDYAKKLSNLIEAELRELELSHAKFEISVNEVEMGLNGVDDVEFLITTNVSQGLMPLVKVASGGEISRVMLAIKIVFAHIDKIKTIIFDEIDTGISGKTSQAVSRALIKLSDMCQVIIITHQAIIAACADCHFWVSKKQEENVTRVFVKKLEKDEYKEALARLAYGEVNEKSLNFAQELLFSCFKKA